MSESVHSDLPSLRRAVRLLADAHGVPVSTRARLVLSVAGPAGRELEAGRTVTLSGVREDGAREGDCALLAVNLSVPAGSGPHDTDLPLPADTTADGLITWRVPVPAARSGGPAGTAVPAQPAAGAPHCVPETEALMEELRDALARADALAVEYRQLKHELTETNSGVLALYVQLDERDEQLRRAHGRILRELEEALRPPPIVADGLEAAVHYAPADADAPTGGDLYDWFTLPDGTVHITVVDALGHGVRSTGSAVNVTHAVRTLALEGHPLESIVGRTAEILLPFDPELMATVLLARMDPATGDLTLANGSHPPALLARAGGSTEYLEVRGRGVGFPLPGSEKLLHTRMEPGDLLVLYTDGLTESRRDPREGERRLAEAALRHRDAPLAQVPGAIAAEMHTVILHPDDTLALAVRRPLPEA